MSDTKTQEEFDTEQDKARSEQGITSDQVVPEQRPQAFNQSAGEESELHKRRRENGDFDPMPKSAYDKAESSAQLKKAEKEEKKNSQPAFDEGIVVKITSGLYEGSIGTIVGLTYANPEEAAKAASGVPSAKAQAKVSDLEIRTRGTANALVFVKAKDVEIVGTGFSSTPVAA